MIPEVGVQVVKPWILIHISEVKIERYVIFSDDCEFIVDWF